MIESRIGNYFLLGILGGALLLTYFIFEPFLAPLFLAAAFAVILQPVYRYFLRLMRGVWPSLASLLTVLVSIICILVPIGAVGTQIGLETAGLYSNLVEGSGRAQITDTIQTLEARLVQYVPAAEGMSAQLSANVSTYAEAGLTWFIQHLGGAFAGVASLFLSLFIFFIALYFLLRDGAELKRTLVRLSPLNDSHDEMVSARLARAVNSVIRGNLTIALIQGVLTAIGFTIFGVPNSVLWGSVAAIAALIPGIGTGLVFVPTIIYLFVVGSTPAALGLLIWGILAVGMIDNFLGPRLIGNGMQLHPLVVLLSVIGGITYFGAIGVFLGPLSVSLLFAVLSIYSDITKNA